MVISVFGEGVLKPRDDGAADMRQRPASLKDSCRPFQNFNTFHFDIQNSTFEIQHS